MRLGAAGSRRIAAAAALAAVVAAATVVVITTRSPASPGGGRGDAATTSGAARVQRRDLVKTDTEAGTLSHPGGRTVYNRLAGTITWLPRVGELIRPGHALFEVDGRPVVLMGGTTPAYRPLSAGDGAGADIEQLNRDLVALGFDDGAIVVDDVWQAATTYGVKLLQRSLGETETGRLTLGQVVFLPGPQLVSSREATVGSTGADTAARVAPRSSQFVELVKKDPHADALSALTARINAQGAQLRAQAAQIKALASRLRAERRRPSPHHHQPSPGGGSPPTGAGATPVLQVTSPRVVVTVELSASSQSEATVGGRVTVEMPAGGTVGGRITAVSVVAQGSRGGGQGGSSPTVPVTITLSGHRHAAGLDQAPVSVTFAQAVARHVLSVPVTALEATSGGRYAVQSAGASRRLIAVRTGLFAAGYVQISGRGIHPGLRVTDSQG